MTISGWRQAGPSGGALDAPPAFARLFGLASPLWPVLLVAATALLYLRHTQTVVYGYDPLGYLLAGTQLAGGQGLSFVDPHSLQAGPYFAPYAFRIFQPGNPYPAYNFPPGYPAILALAARLWPDPRASFFVTPLLAAVGVMVTWWLGRRLCGPLAGLAAAALLALSPLYLQFGTDLWSDLPAAVCGWLGIAFYLGAERREDEKAAGRDGRPRRGGVLAAALAGLLLGYAAWIRYSMAVFALPVAGHALVKILRGPARQPVRLNLLAERPQAFVFLAALAASLGGLLLYDRLFYGGLLETGYSPRQGWYPWPAFSLGYAFGRSPVGGYSLGAGVRTLWDALGPAALLGIAGFAAVPRRRVALIALPAAALWLLYAAYAFQPAGINARFLLPVVPALCLGAGGAAAWAGERCGRLALRRHSLGSLVSLLPALLVIGLALGSFGPAVAAVDARAQATQAQIASVERFTAALEPDAVVMAYGLHDLIGYYGRRSVLNFERMVPVDLQARRYATEAFEACFSQVIARLRKAGTPVYYVVDVEPPAWDSLAALQRHFKTEQVQAPGPLTYRVLDPLAPDKNPAENRPSTGSGTGFRLDSKLPEPDACRP